MAEMADPMEIEEVAITPTTRSEDYAKFRMKLSKIYEKCFKKQYILEPDVLVMHVHLRWEIPRLQSVLTGVQRIISFLHDIHGPRCFVRLDYVTEASANRGHPRTAQFIICNAIRVLRGALVYPTVSSVTEILVERRKRKGDVVSQFLNKFTNCANELKAIELNAVEVELLHALLAFSPQGEAREKEPKGFRWPPEMALNGNSVTDSLNIYLLAMYGFHQHPLRLEKMMKQVRALNEMSVCYATRFMDLPQPQSAPGSSLVILEQEDLELMTDLFYTIDPHTPNTI